ncbi:potassium-transporting ATPase subunit KdpB [uncultured Clostridium sp.]|uniref:potassium-transporting ATPase subunit KdpB n=1 Tax=uncultured Clostridium sp. TaxID=59620 RepID=UPI00262021C9|nr:potassium-transporting ATPase subunit KdpB [uncultured Clostridium sp.]
MRKSRKKFVDSKIMKNAIKDSFKKLNPKEMIKNPVMFVAYVGMIITAILTISPKIAGEEGHLYNGIVTFILFLTVMFANFAESIAEGRGKAQADSLKNTKKDTKAKRVLDKLGNYEIVSATQLHKGDIILVKEGEIIPSDGEVIEGIASINEAAITGESAAVIKESGGDFSSVTGGTTVISDWIKIEITSNPGETFLDKMISLVEGSKRQKSPNEIALNTLLIALTIIFIVVVITLKPIASFVGVEIEISTLIALLVCLIPTTIGGLLSSIGIAGMDRVTRFNVVAMSGKAVEACGDVDVMMLDKTGTITFGNRLAAEFIPIEGVAKDELIKYAMVTSLNDDTPEGRSIIELGEKLGFKINKDDYKDVEFINFTAQSKSSGVVLSDGTVIKKGACSAILEYVKNHGGTVPKDINIIVDNISKLGGTPLVVCVKNEIYGSVYLKDTVKPGLAERFIKLREMGIKTVMCTGDNNLTAKTIAKEAGVDEYIAECKPEDKIEAIIREQALGKVVAMTGDGTNDAPALAQANVGLAMNSGTAAAKEAANMVDLDSDPTKILEIVGIGKQLLITRGALTTFSIANDIAKYFAIIPAMFTVAIPEMQVLNVMNLSSPRSAIISALVFNAIIIPLLIPIALKGVKYRPMNPDKILKRNLSIYGLGGIIIPFIGVKIIDIIISPILTLIGI